MATRGCKGCGGTDVHAPGCIVRVVAGLRADLAEAYRETTRATSALASERAAHAATREREQTALRRVDALTHERRVALDALDAAGASTDIVSHARRAASDRDRITAAAGGLAEAVRREAPGFIDEAPYHFPDTWAALRDFDAAAGEESK